LADALSIADRVPIYGRLSAPATDIEALGPTSPFLASWLRPHVAGGTLIMANTPRHSTGGVFVIR
jgi:hypothetical protein